MAIIETKAFKCERCGHVWLSQDRESIPVSCAKCKSPYWNRKPMMRFSGDSRGHENTIKVSLPE